MRLTDFGLTLSTQPIETRVTFQTTLLQWGLKFETPKSQTTLDNFSQEG